jgi:hypothetical protein
MRQHAAHHTPTARPRDVDFECANFGLCGFVDACIAAIASQRFNLSYNIRFGLE